MIRYVVEKLSFSNYKIILTHNFNACNHTNNIDLQYK